MKYINKTLYKDEGEQIVKEFLNCFIHRKGCYPTKFYKAFCSEIDDAHGHVKFRQRLIDNVLIREQNERCCYCMRKLSECKSKTVEHIMLNHSIDKSELDTYRTRTTPLDGLPHSDDYRSAGVGGNPPHPHSIAYQNLIMSCDGILFNESTTSVCCNLKRNHTFLLPFVLYPDIEQTFVYHSDGTAEWTDDPEPPESAKNVIKVLNLNECLLRTIRRIWFFCNENGFDPNVTGKDEIINTMIGCLASPDFTEGESNMILNFKNDKYWKLFMQYDAFANISHLTLQ